MNGLLNPSRGLLIGLIVLFVLLGIINATTDLGVLGFVIFLVLITLLVYFVAVAVHDFQRRRRGSA